MKKKIYKSHNKMICGICSGLAEYFDIDPTIIRLAAVILCLCGCGLGLVAYILGAIIIPDAPVDNQETTN